MSVHTQNDPSSDRLNVHQLCDIVHCYFTVVGNSCCYLLTFHILRVRLDLEKQPTEQLEMLQHVHYNSAMSWEN